MDYTVSRFLRLVVVIMVFAVVAWLLYTLSSIVLIIIVAALIAYILDPVATLLETKGLTRVQATAILFIVIAISFAAIVYFLIPLLIHEFYNIEASMSSDTSAQFFSRIENIISTKIPFIEANSLDLSAEFNDLLRTLSDSFFAIISSVVSIVTTVVIIPFVVFFLLKDGPKMKKSFIQIIPNRYFEMV